MEWRPPLPHGIVAIEKGAFEPSGHPRRWSPTLLLLTIFGLDEIYILIIDRALLEIYKNPLIDSQFE